MSPSKPKCLTSNEPNKPHETPVSRAVRINEVIQEADLSSIKTDEIQIEITEEMVSPENAVIELASHRSLN